MKTISSCCVFLLLVVFTVTGQSNTLSKSSYTVKYPDPWSIEGTADAKQFTIKAAPDSGIMDNFIENLNMVINDLNSPMNAQQYAAFSKGYLPQKIKNFAVLENAKGSLGKDSWYMVFKGVQFGKKLQWKQYYIVKGSKVHILTFTGEATRYKQYIKTINSMMASYTIK
jgi:eukaryotic-like serine/threonine-protein kinase